MAKLKGVGGGYIVKNILGKSTDMLDENGAQFLDMVVAIKNASSDQEKDAVIGLIKSIWRNERAVRDALAFIRSDDIELARQALAGTLSLADHNNKI